MSNEYFEVKQQDIDNDNKSNEEDGRWNAGVDEDDLGWDLEQSAESSLYSSPSSERKRHRRVHRRRHRGMISHPDSEAGCFQYVLHTFSNVLHVYHLLTGLTLLGYSIAIFINHHSSQQQQQQQQQHWHIFPTVLTVWAILQLLAGSTGLHGLHSHICRRYGLTITTYIGITIAIFNSMLLIFYSIRKHSVLQYLRSGQHHFYLTDKYIDAFDHHSTAFILILLALALAEVLRFYMLRRLRSDLLLQDEAKLHLQRRNDARQRIIDQRRWKSTARRGGLPTQHHNDNIESLRPLLTQDHSDDDDYQDDTPGAKEPITTGSLEQYDMDDGDTEHAKARTNTNSAHSSTAWWDEGEVSSSDDFAPINQVLSVRSMEWSNPHHNATTVAGKGPIAADDGPDLSWAQGNHD